MATSFYAGIVEGGFLTGTMIVSLGLVFAWVSNTLLVFCLIIYGYFVFLLCAKIRFEKVSGSTERLIASGSRNSSSVPERKETVVSLRVGTPTHVTKYVTCESPSRQKMSMMRFDKAHASGTK